MSISQCGDTESKKAMENNRNNQLSFHIAFNCVDLILSYSEDTRSLKGFVWHQCDIRVVHFDILLSFVTIMVLQFLRRLLRSMASIRRSHRCKKPSLMDLPCEIRIMIYHHIIFDPGHKRHQLDDSSTWNECNNKSLLQPSGICLPASLQLSKKIKQEAEDVFYQSLAFRPEQAFEPNDVPASQLPEEALEKIKHLEFCTQGQWYSVDYDEIDCKKWCLERYNEEYSRHLCDDDYFRYWDDQTSWSMMSWTIKLPPRGALTNLESITLTIPLIVEAARQRSTWNEFFDFPDTILTRTAECIARLGRVAESCARDVQSLDSERRAPRISFKLVCKSDRMVEKSVSYVEWIGGDDGAMWVAESIADILLEEERTWPLGICTACVDGNFGNHSTSNEDDVEEEDDMHSELFEVGGLCIFSGS